MCGWKQFIVLIMLLFSQACAPADEEIAETKAKRKAVRLAAPLMYEGFLSDFQHFRNAALQYLSENDSVMESFKCRLEAEHKQDNPYYKRTIAKLETKNRELKKRVAEYKVSHHRKWLSFKTEFNADLAELGASYRSLKVRNTHPEIECK